MMWPAILSLKTEQSRYRFLLLFKNIEPQVFCRLLFLNLNYERDFSIAKLLFYYWIGYMYQILNIKHLFQLYDREVHVIFYQKTIWRD